MKRRQRSGPEQLAQALDDPNLTVDDPALEAAIRAADALTPGVAPRESWRAAVKDRMLREAKRAGSAPREGAGTRDGSSGSSIHSVEVETTGDAHIVLADVEEIDEARAREVAAKLERIARAFAPEGQGRGQQ